MEGLGPLLDKAPIWSIVAAIFITVIFSSTGIVPLITRWLSGRFSDKAKAGVSEREQLSEDQRDILERYERLANEADDRTNEATQRYRENLVWYENEFTRLRNAVRERDLTIAKLSDALAMSEVGSRRWRHACNNILQHVHAIRNRLRLAGLPLPDFTAMNDLLGLDEDIDRSLKTLDDND